MSTTWIQHRKWNMSNDSNNISVELIYANTITRKQKWASYSWAQPIYYLSWQKCTQSASPADHTLTTTFPMCVPLKSDANASYMLSKPSYTTSLYFSFPCNKQGSMCIHCLLNPTSHVHVIWNSNFGLILRSVKLTRVLLASTKFNKFRFSRRQRACLVTVISCQEQNV